MRATQVTRGREFVFAIDHGEDFFTLTSLAQLGATYRCSPSTGSADRSDVGGRR
jgi:hypothetical protein